MQTNYTSHFILPQKSKLFLKKQKCALQLIYDQKVLNSILGWGSY